MKAKPIFLVLPFLVVSFCCTAQTSDPYVGSQADRDSLARTGFLIRAAFSRGDVDAIMRFHHPNVIKALGYKNYQNGAEAVKAALAGTLANYHLEFIGNTMESLLVNGNTAIEQSLFTIKSTPVNGGQPLIFKGRSMTVYVRYNNSPTGWASIREQIQPATD
jgi:ketosteroid isomerase-like protein